MNMLWICIWIWYVHHKHPQSELITSKSISCACATIHLAAHVECVVIFCFVYPQSYEGAFGQGPGLEAHGKLSACPVTGNHPRKNKVIFFFGWNFTDMTHCPQVWHAIYDYFVMYWHCVEFWYHDLCHTYIVDIPYSVTRWQHLLCCRLPSADGEIGRSTQQRPAQSLV